MGDIWHRSELRNVCWALNRALNEADKLQEDARGPSTLSSPVDDRIQTLRGGIHFALHQLGSSPEGAAQSHGSVAALKHSGDVLRPGGNWEDVRSGGRGFLPVNAAPSPSFTRSGQPRMLFGTPDSNHDACASSRGKPASARPQQSPGTAPSDGTADEAAGPRAAFTPPRSPPIEPRILAPVLAEETIEDTDDAEVSSPSPARHFSMCLDDEEFPISSDIEGVYEFKLPDSLQPTSPTSTKGSSPSRAHSETDEVAQDFEETLRRLQERDAVASAGAAAQCQRLASAVQELRRSASCGAAPAQELLRNSTTRSDSNSLGRTGKAKVETSCGSGRSNNAPSHMASCADPCADVGVATERGASRFGGDTGCDSNAVAGAGDTSSGFIPCQGCLNKIGQCGLGCMLGWPPPEAGSGSQYNEFGMRQHISLGSRCPAVARNGDSPRHGNSHGYDHADHQQDAVAGHNSVSSSDQLAQAAPINSDIRRSLHSQHVSPYAKLPETDVHCAEHFATQSAPTPSSSSTQVLPSGSVGTTAKACRAGGKVPEFGVTRSPGSTYPDDGSAEKAGGAGRDSRLGSVAGSIDSPLSRSFSISPAKSPSKGDVFRGRYSPVASEGRYSPGAVGNSLHDEGADNRILDDAVASEGRNSPGVASDGFQDCGVTSDGLQRSGSKDSFGWRHSFSFAGSEAPAHEGRSASGSPERLRLGGGVGASVPKSWARGGGYSTQPALAANCCEQAVESGALVGGGNGCQQPVPMPQRLGSGDGRAFQQNSSAFDSHAGISSSNSRGLQQSSRGGGRELPGSNADHVHVTGAVHPQGPGAVAMNRSGSGVLARDPSPQSRREGAQAETNANHTGQSSRCRHGQQIDGASRNGQQFPLSSWSAPPRRTDANSPPRLDPNSPQRMIAHGDEEQCQRVSSPPQKQNLGSSTQGLDPNSRQRMAMQGAVEHRHMDRVDGQQPQMPTRSLDNSDMSGGCPIPAPRRRECMGGSLPSSPVEAGVGHVAFGPGGGGHWVGHSGHQSAPGSPFPGGQVCAPGSPVEAGAGHAVVDVDFSSVDHTGYYGAPNSPVRGGQGWAPRSPSEAGAGPFDFGGYASHHGEPSSPLQCLGFSPTRGGSMAHQSPASVRGAVAGGSPGAFHSGIECGTPRSVVESHDEEYGEMPQVPTPLASPRLPTAALPAEEVASRRSSIFSGVGSDASSVPVAPFPMAGGAPVHESFPVGSSALPSGSASGCVSGVGHSSASSGDEASVAPMVKRVAMLEELLKQSAGARGSGKFRPPGITAVRRGFSDGADTSPEARRHQSWPQDEAQLHSSHGACADGAGRDPLFFGGGKGGKGPGMMGAGGCGKGLDGGGKGGKGPGGGKGPAGEAKAAPPPKAKEATPVPPKAKEASPPETPKGKGKGKGKAPPKAPPKAQAKAKVGEPKASGPKPRKADVKPSRLMKRLFWSSFVLDEEVLKLCRKTVWGAIEEDGFERFDAEELEQMFGEHQSGRASRLFGNQEGGASTGTKKKARPRVRVFEESRRRQVCVMLARLPPVDETVQAVAEMDDVRLNKDQVELLLANAPPAEELAALRSTAAEAEHDTEEALDWDDAEAFILRLSGVPSFALRLQIWAFENSFDERFDIFQQAATDVRSACAALRTSPSIQRLLALALSVGNYLNAGTARGRADGFTIEALAQMRTVKGSKQGPGPVMTLVDYIVQQLERTTPGGLDALFAEGGEAQIVRKATRQKLADLNVELTAYCAQAEGLVKRTASSRDDELDIRGLRVESRLRELGVLQQLFEQAENEYRELCTWFHEGTSQKRERPSDEFFALWDGFLEAVRVSIETTCGGGVRSKKRVGCHRPLQQLKRSFSVADLPSDLSNGKEVGELSGNGTLKDFSSQADANDGDGDTKPSCRSLERRGTVA